MRFVLLLVAAVVAVVAGVVALQWSSKTVPQPPVTAGSPVQSPSVNTVDVLVAKEPIPMGTVIKDSMVDKQPWPEHLVLEGFIVGNSKDANIAGKVARTNFQAREPFMANKLANPNDPSFLAAALPEGMRAVTLATDAVSGVAGYVFPGDRVDVLLTHNVPDEIKVAKVPGAPHSDKPAYTEVLVPNAAVLAVNTREIKETTNVTPASVTIEVDPIHAEKLRLAEKSGTLSLALRSMKDKEDDTLPDPATLETISRIHVTAAEAAASPEGVRIVRGVGHDDALAQFLAPATASPVQPQAAPMVLR